VIPKDELLSEVEGEFAAAAEAARPEWLVGVILAGIVQFEAAEEGAYMIEQFVDDTSMEFPIHIVHGSPSGIELP
jgi:hypothetical protein